MKLFPVAVLLSCIEEDLSKKYRSVRSQPSPEPRGNYFLAKPEKAYSQNDAFRSCFLINQVLLERVQQLCYCMTICEAQNRIVDVTSRRGSWDSYP